MFSLFKGKKRQRPVYSPRLPEAGDPADRVRTLRSQGLPDSQIIKMLREEGFTPLEVDKAMKDSLRYGVVNEQAQRQDMYDTSLPVPGEDVAEPSPVEGRRFVFPDEEEAPPRPPRPEPPAPMGPGREAPEPPFREDYEDEDLEDEEMPPLRTVGRTTPWEKKIRGKREMEEAVEGVVEEKWGELERKTEDMTSKILHIENKINTLEKFISEIQTEKKSELDEIKELIDTYKVSISDVTAKMDSLERVMRDALTPMMHSLRSLADTIKVMKEK